MSGERWLASTIRKRLLEDNLNWIGLWTGPSGSGKSWAAMRIAELVEPGFTVKRIVFDAETFLARVQELPRGAVLLLDEAGVAAPAREWASFLNRAVAYITESFRFKGQALLLTTPDPRFLDAIPRRLLHMTIEMLRAYPSKGFSQGRPYWIQENPRVGKTYWKHPRLRTERGPVRLRVMRFDRPSAKLRKAYERARAAHMDSLYSSLERTAKAMHEGPPPSVPEQARAIVETVQGLKDRSHLLNTRGDMDPDLLGLEFNVSRDVARMAAKALRHVRGDPA